MTSNSNIDEILDSVYGVGVWVTQQRALSKPVGTKTSDILFEAKQAIQQELLKARIDELKLNAYYSQGKKTDPLKLCGISKNAEEVNDRIANLQAKLKDTTRESE